MIEAILPPLIGGMLIGLSSSTMLGGLGRITGISGIVGSVISLPSREHIWRYNFLFGLILGGIGMYFIKPEFFNYSLQANPLRVVLAGILVGYGTRMGGGCTSGHGVCGLPRRAKRSFVATITFILFGMIVVAIEGAL